jgi:uncharacterized protein (TIGR00369 family)
MSAAAPEVLAALAARAAAVPYHARLGIVVAELSRDHVRLHLPYRDENSNPGRALHGGVYASLIDVAAALAARSDIAAADGLEHRTLDLAVVYLAAAIGCDVVAEARILRRGKELAYAEVAVDDGGGKALARGLVTHRFAPPAPPERVRRAGPGPEIEPGGEIPRWAELMTALPFMAARGMRVTRVGDGRSIVAMPCGDANGDGAGGVHEGALAALLDSAGAVASWSLTGFDPRYKASTASIHASFHAPARGEDVVAHGRTLTRDNESFLNAVTIYGARSGETIATGSVTYRIVV